MVILKSKLPEPMTAAPAMPMGAPVQDRWHTKLGAQNAAAKKLCERILEFLDTQTQHVVWSDIKMWLIENYPEDYTNSEVPEGAKGIDGKLIKLTLLNNRDIGQMCEEMSRGEGAKVVL
jgi:hypothetical protein